MATDVSEEAIAYCKTTMPQYANHFNVLDCLSDKVGVKFDFIYAIAVIHMFVLDEDRNGFYQFVYDHLSTKGIALICSMDHGSARRNSLLSDLFKISEKEMMKRRSCFKQKNGNRSAG